jgi:hypothetical protein
MCFQFVFIRVHLWLTVFQKPARLLLYRGDRSECGAAEAQPQYGDVPRGDGESAAPRLSAIALRPGKLRSVPSVLLLAGKVMLDVPTIWPLLLFTVIVTTAAIALGLTIATAVVKLVSSQINVASVENALERGTTASWSGTPGALCLNTPYA